MADPAVTQSLADDGLSLGDVSVLGLQRSVKVTRGGAPPQSARRQRSPTLPIDDLSFEDASVLGLQRSVSVKRGVSPPSPRSEHGQVTHAKADPAVTQSLADDGLSLGDVSVLGLQRSVKVTRGGAPPQSARRQRSPTLPIEDLSFEDASVLGLQRSVSVKRGVSPPSPQSEHGQVTHAKADPAVTQSLAEDG